MRNVIFTIASLALQALALTAHAAPTQDVVNGVLTFDVDDQYIVARTGANNDQVCNYTQGEVCTLEAGKYRWRNMTTGEKGFFWSFRFGYNQPELSQSVAEPTEISSLPTSAGAPVYVLTEDQVKAIAEAVFHENCLVVEE